jgi:hypothetical protein
MESRGFVHVRLLRHAGRIHWDDSQQLPLQRRVAGTRISASITCGRYHNALTGMFESMDSQWLYAGDG